MKAAAAQIDCEVGEIQENLESHYQLVELAIEQGVDFITFPEMSITGYCREGAARLAFRLTDNRLQKLQKLSSNGNITVVAGAPIQIDNELYIGSFICRPDGKTDIYTKQYLHDGEELFFSSSKSFDPQLHIGSEKIALAICADISNDSHAKCAKNHGATLYAPGIFFSSGGMEKGNQTLSQCAMTHRMNVLMSNYCGQHWGMHAGGKSGFWNTRGEKLAELGERQTGLILAEGGNDDWKVDILVL